MSRKIQSVAACLVACRVWLAPPVPAAEVYFHKALPELTITEGKLPDVQPRHEFVIVGSAGVQAATQPYAVLDGGGEVYLDRTDPNPGNGQPGPLGAMTRADFVAFRVPEKGEVKGTLFVVVWRDGAAKVVPVPFEVASPAEQDDGKAVFAAAKARHFARLLARRDLPGGAWFTWQMSAARSLLPAGAANAPAANFPPSTPTGLEPTFRFFNAGRAVDENLQLDRPMEPQVVPAAAVPQPHYANKPAPKAAARVKIDTLKGITVAEMDWAARLKGRTPTLDPLAANIPADQHALFLPGLQAVAALLTEYQGDDLPVLGLLSTRSEDRGVLRRYERQLGVALADLGRAPGRDAVKGLAVTGSDPDLPGGTDIALLIETGAPDELTSFLKERIDHARRDHADAEDADGAIEGVRYHGARSPDRALSAYLAAVGPVVVVTNSTAQLRRLIDAAKCKTPNLSDAPEYRFFRDRYPRGDADESAFLILTDATIRRWCGPTWRIGSSRRVRAARELAAIKAENLRYFVGEAQDVVKAAPSPPRPIDLGPLHFTHAAVRSETYGTPDFLTPVVELSIAEVERAEADAYNRWRTNYQQNWRGFFDPIAVRLTVQPGRRLAADVSVLPLIAGSIYQPYLDVVGKARLAPGAGDPHAGTLAHAVMAIDPESMMFRTRGEQLSRLADLSRRVALGWIGSSAAVYIDEDPFWAELAASPQKDDLLWKHADRIAVGVHVEVTDAARLAVFLTGVHAFVDQSAPNLVHWESREHKGERYVRVGKVGREDPDWPRYGLYYYASPRSLTLSLSEAVIRRAIERQQAKAPDPKDGPGPWLGRSLAARVSRGGFEALGSAGGTEYREELQARSWGNLPILNEWQRLFPDRDPVKVHEAVWGATLVDPGGGRYVWNPRWATMESTALGHPGEPKGGHELTNPLGRVGSAALGLSFEDGGLRARTEVELRPKP